MQKINKEKEKTAKPKRCISSNQEFYRHSNLYSLQDSFTQFSQVSLQNDNHYYQELNPSALNQEITSTKMLNIEDIEGDLFFNQKLFIEAVGLKNGLRGKKDGFAFFGSITHYKGKVINDFVLNLNDEIMTNIKVKIYFAIYYDRTVNRFYLKNVKKIDYYSNRQLDLNYIIFYRIDRKELPLINRHLFQLEMEYIVYIEILNDLSIKVDVLSRSGGLERYVPISLIIFSSYCFLKTDSPLTLGFQGKIDLEKKKHLTLLLFNEDDQRWMIKEKKDELWMACDRKVELKNVHRFKLDKDKFEITCTDL